MPRANSPDVELTDVRAWERPDLPPEVHYHYCVVASPRLPFGAARVALVWIPVPSFQLVLFHEGEMLSRGKGGDITGAWIRAAARLQERVTPAALKEAIKLAQWQLDGALPGIRSPRP